MKNIEDLTDLTEDSFLMLSFPEDSSVDFPFAFPCFLRRLCLVTVSIILKNAFPGSHISQLTKGADETWRVGGYYHHPSPTSVSTVSCSFCGVSSHQEVIAAMWPQPDEFSVGSDSFPLASCNPDGWVASLSPGCLNFSTVVVKNYTH